jgi:hypothetical protein
LPARRLDHVTLVDVRIEKAVRLNPGRVAIFLDVFTELEGLLRRGGPMQGMLVELATSLGRDPSGQRLRITANARLREDHAGPLKAMFALVAVGGEIVSSGSLMMVERRDTPGFRVAFHVPVLPGRYQLRFAVADASGQFGAAQQELRPAEANRELLRERSGSGLGRRGQSAPVSRTG